MLREIPLRVISKWPVANLTDPESRGCDLAVASGVLLAAGSAALSYSLWKRHGKLRHTLLITAYVFAVLSTSFALLNVYRYGGNIHIWDFGERFSKSYNIGNLICVATYQVSISLAKLALLFEMKSKYGRSVYVFVGLTIGYLIFAPLVTLFQCRPVDAYWNLNVGGKCIDEANFILASGLVNMILIWCLFGMALASPWGVLLAAPPGILVIVASLLRTYYSSQIPLEFDVTWINYDLYIWQVVEMFAGIGVVAVYGIILLDRTQIGPGHRDRVFSEAGSGFTFKFTSRAASDTSVSPLHVAWAVDTQDNFPRGPRRFTKVGSLTG